LKKAFKSPYFFDISYKTFKNQMKFLFLLFLTLFISDTLSQRYSSSNSLLSAYQSILQVSSKDFKNVDFAIDLLTNLTIKLANSSQKTCKE